MIDAPVSHARLRVKQRYGYDYTGRDLANICAMIRRGDADAHVERADRDGALRVVVIYQRKALFCLYDPALHRILTFMPHGWSDGPLRGPSTRRDYARAKRRAGERMR